MSALLTCPDPTDLGLPSRFAAFRHEQWEAIEHAHFATTRFTGLAMPTGIGKTLTAMALSMLSSRSVILTSTRGLQQQYMDDFKVSGLVNIWGKANYTCAMDRSSHCDRRGGTCMKCNMPGSGGYESALRQAQQADHLVTNYAFWLNVNRRGRTLEHEQGQEPRPFELLVLDEAHLAVRELENFLRVEIGQRELQEWGPLPGGEDVSQWADWARIRRAQVMAMIKSLKAKPDPSHGHRIDQLEDLADRLFTVARASDEYWVCEEFKGPRRWSFDPITVGGLAESRLFCGIPRVVLMGATLHPKELMRLGIGKGDSTFREWKRSFPPNRCPVIHVPGVRVNRHIKEDGTRKWVGVIDGILSGRSDRKGLVHTVSYARQQLLLRASKFLRVMEKNDRGGEPAGETLTRFKQARPPRVLVSPSFSTGIDLPMEEAEYQIISKLPFPDTRSKVMQARKSHDPELVNYLTMQELVQACGRLMRSAEDRSETLIVDDSIKWFWWQARHLAPKWFDIRWVAEVPRPPISLAKEAQVAGSAP